MFSPKNIAPPQKNVASSVPDARPPFYRWLMNSEAHSGMFSRDSQIGPHKKESHTSGETDFRK